MKLLNPRCPTSIMTLALFECLGAASYVALLFMTPMGSRDSIALFIGAVLGFVVVYSLWRLQSWAFWLTTIYEIMQIFYEMFLLIQPEYRSVHMLAPIFGILLSVVTVAYLFCDRSVKPLFQRNMAS